MKVTELKVYCSIGKRIPFEELCDVWLILSSTSYLVQFHNAGTKEDSRSVPGHSRFGKIEKFTNEHYEEEEIQMRHAQGEP